MDGKVVAGGAAAGLGLAPDWLKHLAFDFSRSKNLGGGRRGTARTGECPRFGPGCGFLPNLFLSGLWVFVK